MQSLSLLSWSLSTEKLKLTPHHHQMRFQFTRDHLHGNTSLFNIWGAWRRLTKNSCLYSKNGCALFPWKSFQWGLWPKNTAIDLQVHHGLGRQVHLWSQGLPCDLWRQHKCCYSARYTDKILHSTIQAVVSSRALYCNGLMQHDTMKMRPVLFLENGQPDLQFQ